MGIREERLLDYQVTDKGIEEFLSESTEFNKDEMRLLRGQLLNTWRAAVAQVNIRMFDGETVGVTLEDAARYMLNRDKEFRAYMHAKYGKRFTEIESMDSSYYLDRSSEFDCGNQVIKNGYITAEMVEYYLSSTATFNEDELEFLKGLKLGSWVGAHLSLAIESNKQKGNIVVTLLDIAKDLVKHKEWYENFKPSSAISRYKAQVDGIEPLNQLKQFEESEPEEKEAPYSDYTADRDDALEHC